MTCERLDEWNEVTDVIDDVMAYDDVTGWGGVSNCWPFAENGLS
jgi:hypothetical protein